MQHYPYFRQPMPPYDVYGHHNEEVYFQPYGTAYNSIHPGDSTGMNFPKQTPYEQFKKPPLPVFWENEISNQPNPQGNPANSVMAHFQDENGQLNLDKMLTTVGQMANTYHQVYPIFKQFSNFIKNFKTS